MTCYFEKLMIAANRNLCGYGFTTGVKASNFARIQADKFAMKRFYLQHYGSVMETQGFGQ